MQKILLALWGKARCGKATTIQLLINNIKRIGAGVTIISETSVDGNDVVIVKVKNRIIGITGRGDKVAQLDESFKHFLLKECTVIICAFQVLKEKETTKYIENFSGVNGYDVDWIPKSVTNNTSMEPTLNKDDSDLIFLQLMFFLDDN